MKTLLIIASIVVLLVIYSCLVMASRCSRDEEEAQMNENKIKCVDIWFKDESTIQIIGDEATNTVNELYRYSREGVPRFFEGGKDYFYNSETVDSFRIVYEREGE